MTKTAHLLLIAIVTIAAYKGVNEYIYAEDYNYSNLPGYTKMVSFKGHDFVFWSRVGSSTVFHDPECRKCRLKGR
jgi:hypothetical protein